MVLSAVCNCSVCVFFFFLFRGSDGPHIEARFRQFPQLTKKQVFDAELLSGAMWFWILWHCWHEPDAVLVRQNFKYDAVKARRMYEMGSKVGPSNLLILGEKCVYIKILHCPRFHNPAIRTSL